MGTLGGMTPTGRKVIGPAADLVEVEGGPAGGKHTALVFHEGLRDHPALPDAVASVLDFCDKGPITGLPDLIDYIPEEGAFLYKTGAVWSVDEIVRVLADQGRVAGVKAGLEFLYFSARALEEASERALKMRLPSPTHGNINPWRTLVRANGDVQIIGYGLPQVEILALLEDESRVPKEDSFRYTVPERLSGQPEDFTSDLFALSLVGFELMTGRPVYDGLLADIRQQAARAEGMRRLHQVRDQIPEGVRDLLHRAIRPDQDARFPSVNEYVYGVYDLLNAPDTEGPHLIEMMQKVRGGKKPKVLMGGHTGALSKEQLAALREELEEQDAKPLPPPKGPRPDANAPPPPPVDEAPARWGRASPRSTAPSLAPTPAPTPAARPAERPAERPTERPMRRTIGEDPPSAVRGERSSTAERILRRRDADPVRPADGPRRIRDAEPRASEPRAEPAPAAAAEPARPNATEALLNRLRTSASRESNAPQAAPPPREAPPAREVPPAVVPAVAPPARSPNTLSTSDGGHPAAPRSADTAYFQVSVDGGPPQRTRLKTTDALAEATRALVNAMASPPVDLAGNSLGWFRIEQDGQRWRGDSPVSVLNPERPVQLARVPNRTILATIEVEGVNPPMHFQAPVGTAVPMRWMIAHLQRWLRLPEGNWSVLAGGHPLAPMQFLEEIEPSDGIVLTVRR